MKGVIFDWTINVGNLLTIFGFVLTFTLFVNSLNWRMKHAEKRLNDLDLAIAKIDTTLEKIELILRSNAVMQEQILQLRKDIDELRHGEGHVFPLWRSPHEAGSR